MRAAEMYLVEAEARVRNGQNELAQTALFTLANARNSNYVRSTRTGQALIDEIMIQRRVEL
jgi:starch-binding outer membrane protein, SusD/RagB family